MPYDKQGRFVSMGDAIDAWAPIATVLLKDTAKRYNAVVTYKQLGEVVQSRSGVSHNGLLTNWIGSLLGRVIELCTEEQIPQLGALCVKEDGTVGDGYRHAAIASGGSSGMDLDELDDHAAMTRLECYRYFGANLPPGGGEPVLTPRARAARERKVREARKHEPPKLCPTCFTVLPVTGVCDGCT